MWRTLASGGALALGLCLATPGLAQLVAPFAGEHAGFTRVVLRLPAGSGWQLSPEGRTRLFTLDAPGLRFDLGALFERIPRTRLGDASAEGATLRLDLACDCPVRAWEERPGLVILDIADAPPAPLAAPVLAPPARRPPALPVRPDPLDAGRAAGVALARSLPAPEAQPAVPVSEDPRLATLAQDLGRTLAAAMGQGILEPDMDRTATGTGLLEDTPLPLMPENMRVATVLERSNPATSAAPPFAANCAGSEVLDSMLVLDASRFSEEYGRLARGLYGEFDQPAPDVLLELTALYLSAGFGAEARALVENSQALVAGRDFVLGMADVLEGRASNSRMRLAQAIDCGGTASVLAVLAGAPPERILAHADRLALTFINQSATVRDLLGLELAGALAEAGAIDAARIVADALRRSEWVRPEAVALVAARLDRARGLPVDAAARLDHEGGQDSASVQTRLDLALETQTGLERGYLADAEALAASQRGDGTGPELLASVVRLHARSGALPDAFAALDRLESWMSDTGENHRLLGDLRDEVWSALADNGTDFGLVEAVLAREDWRDAALPDDTRRALARRLLDLGFATPIEELVGALDDPDARLLRARAALARAETGEALRLLEGDVGTAARQTRAAALEQLGDHTGAAAEFDALGIADAAVRAAILAGEWRRVEAMADGPAGAADLGQMLGRAPGHAEIARAQAAEVPVAAAVPAGAGASDSREAAPRPTAPDPAAVVAPQGAATDPEAAQAPQAALNDAGRGPDTALAGPVGAPDAPPAGPIDALSTSGVRRNDLPAEGETHVGATTDRVTPDRVRTDGDVAEGGAPATAALAMTDMPDPGETFDRLGLVRRSSTLLAESERLRDALAPLLTVGN